MATVAAPGTATPPLLNLRKLSSARICILQHWLRYVPWPINGWPKIQLECPCTPRLQAIRLQEYSGMMRKQLATALYDTYEYAICTLATSV